MGTKTDEIEEQELKIEEGNGIVSSKFGSFCSSPSVVCLAQKVSQLQNNKSSYSSRYLDEILKLFDMQINSFSDLNMIMNFFKFYNFFICFILVILEWKKYGEIYHLNR